MGLQIEGLVSVEQMILNLDTTGRKRVVKGLYVQAIKLRDLARKFAPEDRGNLEKAINVFPAELEGAIRDERGRFARQEIEVVIDMDMPIEERPGKTVGDYAYEMHEHMEPYGNFYNLGPKSLAKQDREGVVVGGGFLERAAEEIEAQMDDVLLDILREL